MLGIQKPSRKIIISRGISERTAEDVVSQIEEINDYDDFERATIESVGGIYTPDPISMTINSGGGNTSDGFAIIASMEMSEAPIATYALGSCGSMALAIFVSGDIRFAHRYCRLMYHQIAYGMMGNLKEHRDQEKEASYIQRMYDDVILTRTKMSKDHLEHIKDYGKDFYFSGREAVKFGVADEVILKPEKKFGLVTEEQYREIEELIHAELEKSQVK